MSGESPSLRRTLLEAIDGALVDLHTCMPGVIESYDPASGLANVAPSLKRQYVDGELVKLPIINNVPVVMPRAAGGAAYISLPLAAGDPVTLVFSERSLDNWKSDGHEVDPQDERRHHLSDAYAFPGGYPQTFDPMAEASADDLVVVNGEATFVLAPDGTVTAAAGAAGAVMAITPEGKLTVTNATGELLAALCNLFSSLTTAGGFPLVASPADLIVLQGFKA